MIHVVEGKGLRFDANLSNVLFKASDGDTIVVPNAVKRELTLRTIQRMKKNINVEVGDVSRKTEPVVYN